VSGFSDIIGRLDETNQTPLYQQLQRALRHAITSKTLSAEAALPPERDLAEEFSISRITVRKALDGLVEEGLLTRRQGSGTFVAGQRVEKNFSKLSSFTEDMAARGRKAHSIWLSRAEGVVTPDEALSLGLAPGSTVYRFHRIRYADEAPMALEYSTVPSFCLPGVETVGDSLYTALDQAGCRPVRALQRLRAVLFTADQAQLLGVNERDAGLRIERRGFLENGRLVEITTSYYRGDAYDFVAELNALSS
jgi:GntR family transcriptional regulator